MGDKGVGILPLLKFKYVHKWSLNHICHFEHTVNIFQTAINGKTTGKLYLMHDCSTS